MHSISPWIILDILPPAVPVADNS